MGEKKDAFRFTVQFNAGDPSHQQVAAILNEQGRRKAQFLVNAVIHYINCPESPEAATAPKRSADSGTVGTRDINQYAAGNHTHNGEEYGQRYPTCHGIRKHPVRCRRHAGRRWLPFAPEFLGCDTAIGALINLLKHPSAAYLVVDAKK